MEGIRYVANYAGRLEIVLARGLGSRGTRQKLP